jgi:hypothetical protein
MENFEMAALTTSRKQRGPSFQKAREALSREILDAQPGKTADAAPTTSQERCGHPIGPMKPLAVPSRRIHLYEKKIVPQRPSYKRADPLFCGSAPMPRWME